MIQFSVFMTIFSQSVESQELILFYFIGI